MVLLTSPRDLAKRNDAEDMTKGVREERGEMPFFKICSNLEINVTWLDILIWDEKKEIIGRQWCSSPRYKF